MARYVVNVPEYLSRKKFTAGQFLVEFAETWGGRSKLPRLPHPVTICFVDSTEAGHREIFREAAPLFALFQRIAVCKGAIYRLSWKGCAIGPAGLYELNNAIRNPAVRKGGLNIVRHWLENRGGCLTPFGSDLSALFDFLEIRPLFQREKAKNAPSLSTENHAPESQNAIRYV